MLMVASNDRLFCELVAEAADESAARSKEYFMVGCCSDLRSNGVLEDREGQHKKRLPHAYYILYIQYLCQLVRVFWKKCS